jgi:hypothetical protein
MPASDDGVPRQTGAAQQPGTGDDRAAGRGDRLAAAMRENLRRRKAQQRARVVDGGTAAGPAEPGERGPK